MERLFIMVEKQPPPKGKYNPYLLTIKDCGSQALTLFKLKSSFFSSADSVNFFPLAYFRKLCNSYLVYIYLSYSSADVSKAET